MKVAEVIAAVLAILATGVFLGGPFLYERARIAEVRVGVDQVITLTGVAASGVWTEDKVHGGNYWKRDFKPARLNLVEGEKVLLVLKSADVTHRFYSPYLGIGPIEVKPGHVEFVTFTAPAPGTYIYYCDVICGECHFFMRGTIQVLSTAAAASRTPTPTVSIQTCPRALAPPSTDDPVMQGEFLYRKLGCIACHEGPGAGVGINVPPSTEYVGSKLKPEWLVAFLLDPKPIRWEKERTRPAMRMPNFHLSTKKVHDLTAYLMLKTNKTLIPPTGIDWASSASPAEIRKGRRVFELYQCQGCHQLNGVGGQIGPALDGVGSKLHPDYIFAWVRNLQKIVPGTPMQDKNLWEKEAEALVRYLSTLK